MSWQIQKENRYNCSDLERKGNAHALQIIIIQPLPNTESDLRHAFNIEILLQICVRIVSK